MKKKIMILGASILQLPAIIKAKEMGLDVIVVDMNPNAIGFQENNVKREIISTIDIPKVVEAARKHKIDGIMTLASDMPIRTVATVSKELGLPGIDEKTAINATNKYEMRKALNDAGVPIPKFYRVSTVEDFLNCIHTFKSKYITKPSDNSGSRGICLVDDDSKALESFFYSKENSRNGDVVIEEYMEGPEVSVETLTINGNCFIIQITDKLTTGAPHFVEMGHSQPSTLSFDIQEKIKNVAIAATKAIGIQNGPSHTEIIVTKDGPKIVELGARLGGDCITTHLVPLSVGVDMVECCIRISLGEEPLIEKKYEKASAIRYLKQHNGIVKTISGVDEAKKVKGIKDVFIAIKEHDCINDIINSASRIGFVISQDDTVDKAIDDCKKAIELINIEYD